MDIERCVLNCQCQFFFSRDLGQEWIRRIIGEYALPVIMQPRIQEVTIVCAATKDTPSAI